MPLTDAAIRHLKPGPKSHKVADSAGLFLFVTESGSKLWRMRYRFGGKEKVLSFGSYPEVSLAEAREKRDDARRLLREGTDPSEQKRIEKLTSALSRENTFGAIAEEYVLLLKRKSRAQATINKVEWLLDFARPALGKRPVREIMAPEILAVLRHIEKRGRLETAHRLRSTIGAVFRFAIASGLADADPSQALRGAVAPPTVRHHAALTSAKEVGALLRAIRGYDGSPEVRIALELAAVLFPRPGELRQAEWREIDFDGKVWTVPAERMKMREEHRVPLPAQSIALLRELYAISGRGKLLFPSVRSGTRPISDGTMNAALRRLAYTSDQMTAHGFRSTASTLLNESGKWSTDAIERQLAHQDGNEIRRIYQRGAFWPERVEMMGWWADYLDTLRKGAEIVPFEARR
ncbi:integrase arm-type DNA-binding domain-containing protein [Aminobacter sp. AP02]|uniref:tyrosine-type recombinase/integrase n=1 Tax=Aminobacter sp. AP02 TaxID=2135737 RepID=UPI000D6B4071|nr:integrase arm-type DNA-binding domain-containing protein [Aminobacter sp. AP02]PWK66933.1 integrase [Aminobacter sp. AP02]